MTTKRKTAKAAPISAAALPIGRNVLIRTVTFNYTGKLLAASTTELLLEDAAWIADTGRFFNALQTGELSEVEPFLGRVWIGRGSVIDLCEWIKDLPRRQK